MRKTLFTLALVASALIIPLEAHADTIDQFTFSFPTSPNFLPANLIIDLPASPPPSYWNGYGVCYSNCFSVVGMSGGNNFIVDFTQLTAGQTLVQYAIFDPQFGPPSVPRAYTHIYAPTLFSGSIADPTFLTGTFDAEYQPVITFPQFPGTITIEPQTNTPVPEPSTLLFFATGVAGLLLLVTRRRPVASLLL